MADSFAALYAPKPGEAFTAKYRARCLCGAVRYALAADPLDAKICHCATCQALHGAPMQWAAIFRKDDVRVLAGLNAIRFYDSAGDRHGRVLPCKLRCARCGAPIADEGRRMWLAFPPLFDFGRPPAVPDAFRPTCHIFYASRSLDVNDGLPKWAGHKDRSARL